MSADLELIMRMIKTIASVEACDDTDGDVGNNGIGCTSSEEDEEFNCRTPKSPCHMIPAILSCPLPPRKPKTWRPRSCKRKLFVKLQYFEISARDEVESFFRMAEENIDGAKRRCVM